MKLKIVSCVLIVGLLISTIPVTAQSSVTPLAVLSEVEQLLYGKVQSGAVLARIEQIENEIFGEVQSGPVMTRIDRIDEFLEGNLMSSGLKLQLNLVEWGFSAALNAHEPLLKRLEKIESEFFGAPQEGSLDNRVKQMMVFIWGITELDFKPVNIEEQTLVEIQLLQTVDSGKNKEGDEVKYRVSSDVIVDDRIVIPKGAIGIGKITQVVSAGSLGRNGRIVIDFGAVPALDGSNIRLQMSERATEENRRLELAAGASMAGVLLLGPLGLAGGYFVKGEDVQIKSETRFFVETERTRETLGFLLAPVKR